MNYFYTIVALDIARDRANEAASERRLAELSDGRPSLVRRGLANGLAAVSRGSAAVARRLDDRTADDLVRSLAPSK
jgi:hypothetical protein